MNHANPDTVLREAKRLAQHLRTTNPDTALSALLSAIPMVLSRHGDPRQAFFQSIQVAQLLYYQPGPVSVRVDAEEEGGWWVSVCVGGELVEIHGDDLAETLRLARETAARELVPLLRAIGADIITAALAAKE